jgi:hypothetical protein
MTSGGGGLEVRGDGHRQDLPLALHGCLYSGHSFDHPPGAQSLRHYEAHRHKVQQNREEKTDAAEYGRRGGLVDVEARWTSRY